MSELDRRIRNGPWPILCDGAIGSSLLADANGRRVEHLNLADPNLVTALHKSFIVAGAEAATTNTFCSTRGSLQPLPSSYEIEEINRTAVQAARLAQPAFVLGSCGPLPPGAMDVGDKYTEQLRTLLEAGIDGVLFETVRSLENMGAGLAAAQAVMRELDRQVPVIITYSPVDVSLKLVDGTIDELVSMALGWPIAALGVNCGDGGELCYRALKRIRANWKGPLVAAPSAGLPSRTEPGAAYPLGVEAWAEQVYGWSREFACAAVGGCCGTTPEYIAQLRQLIDSA